MNDPKSPGPDDPAQNTPNQTAKAEPAAGPHPQPTEPESTTQKSKPSPGVHKPLSIGVLGQIDSLSEEEQIDLMACEEVISSGWNTFVEVGLALARIRDKGLFRDEYESFETYCRSKWQYKLRYAYDLINAAKVHTFLCANCAKVKPDHESQVRPLVGLPPELAKQAWETAVDRAQGQRITARLVKSVVKALKPPKPDTDPQSASAAAAGPDAQKITKKELKRLIDDTVGQLLALISQKAAYELLTEKAEELYGHVQTLIGKDVR